MEDNTFDALVIDTSVVIRNGLKLLSGPLAQLTQFKDSPVQIVLPDIVENEILVHLAKKYEEVRIQYEKSKSDVRAYGLASDFKLEDSESNHITEAQIRLVAKAHLDNFLNDTGAIVLQADSLVRLQSITRLYFDEKPPFSSKKKNEFPDAIALISIDEWARNENMRTIVVSFDEDWAAFCKNRGMLHFERELTKGLELFQRSHDFAERKHRLEQAIIFNHIPGFKDIVNNYLQGAFDQHEVIAHADSIASTGLVDAQTRLRRYDFIRESPSSLSFTVITSGLDYFSIELVVEGELEVEAEFIVGARDSLDGDYVSLGRFTANEVFEFESSLLVTFEGTLQDDPSSLKVKDLEVYDMPGEVDFGFITPDWG